VPREFWGPDYTDATSKEYVSLDLQAYYNIDEIILHDGGGNKGQISIFIADAPNGPWVKIITYDAVKFNDWVTFKQPIPNDQPIRYLKFEASADNNVAVGEIFLCGSKK